MIRVSNVAKEFELYRRYGELFKEPDKAVQSITAVHLAKQLQVHMSSNLDFDLILRHVLDLGSENLFSRIRDNETNAAGVISGVHEKTFALFIHRLATLMRLEQNGLRIPEDEYESYILTDQQKFYIGNVLSEMHNQLLDKCKPLKDGVGS